MSYPYPVYTTNYYYPPTYQTTTTYNPITGQIVPNYPPPTVINPVQTYPTNFPPYHYNQYPY